MSGSASFHSVSTAPLNLIRASIFRVEVIADTEGVGDLYRAIDDLRGRLELEWEF